MVVATIGAPHGVRGAVRLTVHTEDPRSLKRYNPLHIGEAQTVRLNSLREAGKGLVASFEGIEDRDAAQKLKGTDLWVPRARLPVPQEDEFYHVDLLGLEARLASGAVLGKVVEVDDYGAGPVLHLDRGGIVVPFTRAAVPEVALAKGWLTVADDVLTDDSEPPEPDGSA